MICFRQNTSAGVQKQIFALYSLENRPVLLLTHFCSETWHHFLHGTSVDRFNNCFAERTQRNVLCDIQRGPVNSKLPEAYLFCMTEEVPFNTLGLQNCDTVTTEKIICCNLCGHSQMTELITVNKVQCWASASMSKNGSNSTLLLS